MNQVRCVPLALISVATVSRHRRAWTGEGEGVMHGTRSESRYAHGQRSTMMISREAHLSVCVPKSGCGHGGDRACPVRVLAPQAAHFATSLHALTHLVEFGSLDKPDSLSHTVYYGCSILANMVRREQQPRLGNDRDDRDTIAVAPKQPTAPLLQKPQHDGAPAQQPRGKRKRQHSPIPFRNSSNDDEESKRQAHGKRMRAQTRGKTASLTPAQRSQPVEQHHTAQSESDNDRDSYGTPSRKQGDGSRKSANSKRHVVAQDRHRKEDMTDTSSNIDVHWSPGRWNSFLAGNTGSSPAASPSPAASLPPDQLAHVPLADGSSASRASAQPDALVRDIIDRL